MDRLLKSKIGSVKNLQEILGVSHPQAWRIFNGHSNLTKKNEKIIKNSLSLFGSTSKQAKLLANNWIEVKKQEFNEHVDSLTVTKFDSVIAIISVIKDEESINRINELRVIIEQAKDYEIKDALNALYIEILEDNEVARKEFKIKEKQ